MYFKVRAKLLFIGPNNLIQHGATRLSLNRSIHSLTISGQVYQRWLPTRSRSSSRIRLATFLFVGLLVLGYQLGAQDRVSITIPELDVSARWVAPQTIPGRTIPARETPAGVIPTIVVPPIVIEGFWIPGFSTAYAEVPDVDFRQLSPRRVAELPQGSQAQYELPPREVMSKAQRREAFRRFAGFGDSDLFEFFERGDLNRNGQIDWSEISHFQSSIMQTFAYALNDTALRPDTFWTVRQGDCEDFALMTAAFLNYWGWDAIVAGLFDRYSGHAIALVRADGTIPSEYLSWQLEGAVSSAGTGIPHGIYVPIDYQQVGGFSSAVRAGMIMRDYFIPQEIYGTFL